MDEFNGLRMVQGRANHAFEPVQKVLSTAECAGYQRGPSRILIVEQELIHHLSKVRSRT